MATFLRFMRDDTGVTSIEYALIAGVMGIALIAVMPILSSAVGNKFTSLAGHISSAS